MVVRVSVENGTDTHALIRFEVQDSGIGIPLENQARLFESFSQADSSITRQYGGTGLGLAIAKQLVALMEGEIGVRSEPGKGSTFWFTAQVEKQSGEHKMPHASPQDLLQMRVLVVEDNKTNRQILRSQVSGWRMHVGSASSGEEALQRLRLAAREGEPYDVALLDMKMPGMDGFSLAAAIKSDPFLAATRLFIFTSVGHVLSSAELKRRGIEAYLVKPVKQSRLFDCLSARAANKADEEAATRTLPVILSAPDRPKTEPEFKKIRILLAEDNMVNQKVALAQLRRLRYQADAVANGREALEALQRIPYDLILMDCQMPEMDGYETTRVIRQWENRSDSACPWKSPVHIVAITAHAMQGDREQCLAAGMDDYISKPIRLPELQAVLERWQIPLHPDRPGRTDRSRLSSDVAFNPAATADIGCCCCWPDSGHIPLARSVYYVTHRSVVSD